MRRAHDEWQIAKRNWPQLQQFFAGYLHQDWPELEGSPEAAVDHAIADYGPDLLINVVREWADWKERVARVRDPRTSLNDGLGVNVWFKKPHDAREFIAMVNTKLN